MENNYKIKIICEYEKERQEWEALSPEEQHEWQLTADYLKKEWP